MRDQNQQEITDLHELRYTHDGLVRLIEHLPPGEGAVTLSHWLIGQEVGDISHSPISVNKPSVEDACCDVVLQKSLRGSRRRRGNKETSIYPER